MMKASGDNNEYSGDFATGLKALVVIILCIAAIGLLLSALPIIIPMIWLALIIVAFGAMLFCFIQLLGWSINKCNKLRKKGDR